MASAQQETNPIIHVGISFEPHTYTHTDTNTGVTNGIKAVGFEQKLHQCD